MTNHQVFVLAHARARANALEAVRAAPDGRLVLIREKTRTLEQNARYWGRGVLAQIAEKAVIGGRRFSAEAWHEQFKRQFIGIEELPNGQVVGKSSAKLGVRAFSQFVDEVEAFAAAELGVVFDHEVGP